MPDTRSPQDAVEASIKRVGARAWRELGVPRRPSPSRSLFDGTRLELRPLTPAEEDLLRYTVPQDGGHPLARET